MHKVLESWIVRLEHVTAIGLAHVIPGRPNMLQFEIHMLGGNTLNIVGQEKELKAAREDLINACHAFN
ncbi:hypothetical protein [Stenotrophomonas maltophilia]|jgi:hypothetical protein|uniref:hypothetical protein n=1 Tax=Stenotrophomonas maltophilia TaxID=40324 RepID=UPI000C146FE9|nr:hypothetical protein [Stenotrophomonas maltophilia]